MCGTTTRNKGFDFIEKGRWFETLFGREGRVHAGDVEKQRIQWGGCSLWWRGSLVKGESV